MRKTPRRAGLMPGEVTLTFDDGPNLTDDVTPRLLNVLHRHDVKAGFCLVGDQVRRHSAVVQRIFHSGHLLINHTQTHTHPLRMRYSDLLAEVQSCDVELSHALGIPAYRSEYFRAPFGIVTPGVRRVLRQLKMKQMLLSHYGWDTRVGPHNYQSVVDRMIDNAQRHRGGLYVFHDGSLCPAKGDAVDWSESVENRSWIPDAVDQVITELKSDGLRFTLPEQTLTARRILNAG